jgi:hypothetical protein
MMSSGVDAVSLRDLSRRELRERLRDVLRQSPRTAIFGKEAGRIVSEVIRRFLHEDDAAEFFEGGRN